jgi:hypothetical protein
MGVSKEGMSFRRSVATQIGAWLLNENECGCKRVTVLHEEDAKTTELLLQELSRRVVDDEERICLYKSDPKKMPWLGLAAGTGKDKG